MFTAERWPGEELFGHVFFEKQKVAIKSMCWYIWLSCGLLGLFIFLPKISQVQCVNVPFNICNSQTPLIELITQLCSVLNILKMGPGLILIFHGRVGFISSERKWRFSFKE